MKNIKDTIAQMVITYYAKYPSMREDILHTQEVVSYTRLIATGEGLDSKSVDMLEMAAWLHDIGCPEAKEIYGNSLPVSQQIVGRIETDKLLSNISTLTPEQKSWLSNVVGTHHQHRSANEFKFMPLFEADIIANFLSGYYEMTQAQHYYNRLIGSNSGKMLFRTLVLLDNKK
ncbi:MAG: hypothetical protein R3Y50_02740 [Rikenellaceae bacterium]